MSCHDARQFFSVLRAGKLGLTEWVEIEAHVRQCDRCGQALDRLYQLMAKAVDGRRRLPVSPARRARRLAVWVMCIVLVAGMGGYAYQRRHEDRPVARQSAPPERVSVPAEPEGPPPAAAVSAPSAVSAPLPSVMPAGRSEAKTALRNAGAKPSPGSGADVIVSLSAQGRREAERDLRSLLARLGGSRLARDQRSTMKVAVPRSRYDEFIRGLAQIGSWQINTRSASLPDPVRVTVRLTR